MMIILHAGFYNHQLLIWGETPASLDSRPVKRRGRKPKVAKPLPLIYDAGAKKLSQVLTEIGCIFKVEKDTFHNLFAWAPSVDQQPLASSPLIAAIPEAHDEITLIPWQITVVKLPGPALVELLCSCVNQEILAPGVIIGKDLAYWVTALRFAGSLVAGQKFLPGLQVVGGSYRSGWQPVITGLEAPTQAALVAVMPHVCRALTQEAGSPPETPAATVLLDFLSSMVDFLVRSQEPGPPVSKTKATLPKKPSQFDSFHDQWLQSLQAPEGALVGTRQDLEQLAAQIETWQRPVSLTTALPFRLCFRLEEPGEIELDSLEEKTSEVARQEPGGQWRSPAGAGERGEGAGEGERDEPSWYIRYLLQSLDDPSLLIPTADVWQSRSKSTPLLVRDNFNAKEYLLASLGESSRLYPALSDSLRSPAPAGYEVDTLGAFDFLAEKALLLEQSGYGVMLPAWWTSQGTKVRLSARAQVKSGQLKAKAGMSLDQIVRFDYQVALGDEELSLEELRELVRLKSPLVKVRGRWVMLNAEEIKAAMELWKKKGSGRASVRDIIQMSLGGVKAAPGLAFEGVKAEGWIADLLSQLQGQAAYAEAAVPETFQGTLRPYQVRGFSWLSFLRQWGLGACLADDMGLGKTIQALTLIARDWQGDHRSPVLLICPTSVVGNWQKEAARFTPDLPVMVHHGLTRSKGKSFIKQVRKMAMVISSYALLHRDFEILKEVPWSGVILDEAQNIKNPETKQARAARALPADYRIALTGTPVENNVGDLWSIMEFLNPGILGSQAEFKRKFFIPIQANRNPAAAERLKGLTGPFILRRLKTDKQIITDLPEKNEMKVYCNLTKEQASLYSAVVEEVASSLDEAAGIQRKGLILATLAKLKQVCNHPAHFLGDNSPVPGRSGKLNRLSEMLEEVMAVKDRALIFTQFTEMGKILQRHLQETLGREVLFLHGSLTKQQRDLQVERFQQGDGRLPLFILSLKAGGTGLNLTGANHVFHFDRWWNPAVENQATDRAFRIGQRKNVQVHKFVCVGTLEESIDELIERKKEVADNVVGAGEGWLTELSTAELQKLFTLRADAIGE
jgi:SNF2 family DNA or RNA helicase